MELSKEFRFEASHVLPKHPGRCSRLHGHSWKLHVSIEGPINQETGFVQDFADISQIVNPLIEKLDHRHLGEWGHILTDVGELEDPHHHDNWRVPGLPFNFYPTSENLLVWIALQLNGLDVWQLSRDVDPAVKITHPGQIIHTNFPKETTRISWWSKLELEETCTSRATLTRKEYDNA